MIEKFENVQLGETVLVLKEVLGQKYGFGGLAWEMEVWTAEVVEKVTKTQFTAGGVRFRKNGCEVGGSRFAAMDGDIRYSYGDIRIHATHDESVVAHRSALNMISRAVRLIGSRDFNLLEINDVFVAERVASQVVSAHESYVAAIAKDKGGAA